MNSLVLIIIAIISLGISLYSIVSYIIEQRGKKFKSHH
ncbi:small membrane protein [Klebsiella sp. BIGb0407]